MNTLSQYQSIKLEDVIEPNPPTFGSSGTVIEAIDKMNQRDKTSRRYSYILIVDESKLVGIITERDVVRLTAAEIDLSATKVTEVMTKELVTLKKSAFLDVHLMMGIMRQNKIRHLPILEDGGQLAGMVSVYSICRALHPSNLLKFRRVHEAMTTQVLEASTTTSVLALSQMMAKNKESCIVIVDRQKDENNDRSISIPVGIVTERDIVQFQILGLDLAKTIAQTVMSTPLVCLKTQDSLMEVRQQMEKLRVRRLVVVGEKGELQGIVTQFEMLKVLDPTELFGIIKTLQSDLEDKTKQLQKEKELAQITLQSIGDAVIATDAAGKIVNLNPMAEQLTGWKIIEAKGKILAEIFNLINEQTRETVANPVDLVLKENKAFELSNNTILISRNGIEYAIEDSAAPIRNLQGETIGAVIVFRDVTESRRLSRQLSWQASHDSLTGLDNRREFARKLQNAIASAKKQGHHHILCYLDLDRFKIINDTCGHLAGDELLKQITDLLLKQIRSSDILARLGGDEFGFLLQQCPLEAGIKIANNLRQSIEEFRFSWKNKIFSIGVSIGLVEINSGTKDLNSLMNIADAACYMAKARGRNYVYVCQNNDTTLSKNLGQQKWAIELDRALAENRFTLYSQAIIPLKSKGENSTKATNRYEILLRLHDKQGRLIYPNAFIPAAERYELMPAIDRWVISHFMANYDRHCQARQQKQMSECNSIYGINLSGASINSERFRYFLKEQFEGVGFSPTTICFEITETVAISNLETAAKFIRELKELGCSIALDDFGSGMSSLTYLKNLDVDYLKIDGSFVKKIDCDRLSYTTVEYFNQIAKIVNLKTVAEFVENQTILKQLKDIGVDYGQGYGIARPIPLVFSNY